MYSGEWKKTDIKVGFFLSVNFLSIVFFHSNIKRMNKFWLNCFTFVILIGNLVNASIPLQYQESCKNQTVTEFQISNYLQQQTQSNQWDRPLKNACDAIKVRVRMGISSFPKIVCPFFVGLL